MPSCPHDEHVPVILKVYWSRGLSTKMAGPWIAG